jgi:hypothetical protein
MAVARCISSRVANWFNWELWQETTRISPDASINHNLNRIKATRKQIKIKDKHVVLDIKGGGINEFNLRKKNWKQVDSLPDSLCKSEIKKIMQL